MGSSFLRYGDQGFWASDAALELWLCLLAEEARRVDPCPDWLLRAAEDWEVQATAGFVGCISGGLDEHASTAEKAGVVLSLAEKALSRLVERGEVLPVAWLNSLGLGGPGAYFTEDVPLEVFSRVGRAFLGLLRGERTSSEED